MQMIKINPAQNRLTIILTLVAAVAIAATVWRCKPAGIVNAMSRTPNSAPSKASVPTVVELPQRTSRNPFKRPTWVGRTGDRQELDANRNGSGAEDIHPGAVPTLPYPPMFVEPIDSADHRGNERSPVLNTEDEASAQSQSPNFTLLATVKSADRIYAVVRIGDSRVKVVQVGDIVDGGFRVKQLDSGRAVLTDGTDTLTARRQNVQDSQHEKTQH